MSDYKGMAGATLTLRGLLADRMQNPVAVTAAPPDVKVAGVAAKHVNLYLYQVRENPYLRNQEIPGHGSPGAYGKPPLSLDLHYMVTAYPSAETSPDADIEAQRVLGDAMRVLHDFAVITPDLFQVAHPTQPVLDPSLLSQYERVKITLEPVPLEELTKIWSALPTVGFRRSIAYQVSVVQIESRTPSSVALPVRTRRVVVAQLRRPELEAAYRTPAAGEAPGDVRVRVLRELTLEGANFSSSKTWVRLGALEPIQLQPDSDRRLRLTVPDTQYPADVDHPAPRPIPADDLLQPGPQLVQVLTQRDGDVVEGGLDHGTVATDQSVQDSSQLAFMVVPEVIGVNPTNGPAGTVVRVTGKRLYSPGLGTAIHVGNAAFTPLDPADPGSPAGTVRTGAEVRVVVTGLAPSATPYRLRARVNGAESLETNRTFQVTP